MFGGGWCSVVLRVSGFPVVLVLVVGGVVWV